MSRDNFWKIFDYGWQFRSNPGRKDKGLASKSSEGFILKGQFLASSEEKGVGKVSEKRGILVRELPSDKEAKDDFRSHIVFLYSSVYLGYS